MAYFDTYSNASSDPWLTKSGKDPTKGGKMAFGWDDAILGVGSLAGGIFGMMGADKQAQTQANIANAQMAAQADALKQGIMMQRDTAKGNLGAGLQNLIYGSTTGPDLELARQKGAKQFEYDVFAPKEAAINRENARWASAASLDPTQRMASFQNLLNENRKEGFRQALPGELMFGRTAGSGRFTGLA